jgi:uncharacterized protein
MKSNIPTLPAFERRFTPGIVELRAATGEGKAPIIGGHAAKFGTRSEDMGWADIKFFEIIEPGFFDNVLGDDVRGLFNHDANKILGRTASKTCRIAQDSTGLAYEIDAAEEQSYTRDLIISLKRGDVSQSSFAFKIDREGQRWVEEGDTITRYLLKGGARRLYDVSPVTYPAYPAATSEARNLEAMIADARQSGQLTRDAGEALAVAIAQRARDLQLRSL